LDVRLLVAYATRYGSTGGIAERVGERLRKEAGFEVDLLDVADRGAVGDLSRYDAYVIGSALYFGHWLKTAVAFVQDHRESIVGRPTWLFSSGPLGDEPSDDEGQDKRIGAEPEELAALHDAVGPRGHAVFFGALDPGALGLRDRAIRKLPAGRDLLPEGDFREWDEIEGWAAQIARELSSRASDDPEEGV
jgi:menaquinone-dependent protoporphyrinogen oxidase